MALFGVVKSVVGGVGALRGLIDLFINTVRKSSLNFQTLKTKLKMYVFWWVSTKWPIPIKSEKWSGFVLRLFSTDPNALNKECVLLLARAIRLTNLRAFYFLSHVHYILTALFMLHNTVPTTTPQTTTPQGKLMSARSMSCLVSQCNSCMFKSTIDIH